MIIIERPITELKFVSDISIAFEVNFILEFTQVGSKFEFEELLLSSSFVKDYDSVSENHPLDWASEFDMSNWGLIFAEDEGKKIGSALIAYNTNGVNMLDGSKELAVLWDLRVSPEYRGQGVGKSLFDIAKHWARNHHCNELKIETQNNNVGAVKFYLKQGAELRFVKANAYQDFPDEDMLLFYITL